MSNLYSVTVDLNSLKSTIDKVAKINDDTLYEIAVELKNRAYISIANRYQRTKGRGNNRHKGLEQALFAQVSNNQYVKKTGKGEFSINLVPQSNKLDTKFPYWRSQESGKKRHINLQAYYLYFSRKLHHISFANISKQQALEMSDDPRVTYLVVPHPSFRGRFFVKAGINWLNRYGESTAKKLILERMG